MNLSLGYLVLGMIRDMLSGWEALWALNLVFVLEFLKVGIKKMVSTPPCIASISSYAEFLPPQSFPCLSSAVAMTD